MEAIFFQSGDEFRRWLQDNHDRVGELQVGFYKKNSSQQGISYQEVADRALYCGLNASPP